MLGVHSLQQRMVLFLLLPVALLLVAMGWFGFWYARSALVAEWQEAAVLKLQRAAHQVDMRLSEPKFWMQMFQRTGGEPQAEDVQEWILKQLDNLQGIEKASLTRYDSADTSGERGSSTWMRGYSDPWMEKWGGMMEFERGQITEVTPPHYDSQVGHETVSLISSLLSAKDKRVGELNVAVRFDYLMQNALSYGWGKGETASLIDDQGRVLACNLADGRDRICSDEKTLQAVIKAMHEKSSGTILGRSKSPREVVGFYRLKEAPWTLVLTAQDTQILAPIYKFRNIFLIVGSLFIFFVLLLIRTVAGRTVKTISQVSQAAQQVAKGDFQLQLASERQDEVGQLVRSFNTMVMQLEEGIRLKEALDLAMEVQQNLLPSKPPQISAVDIAGTSIYCDETGGDYYDFLEFSEPGEGKLAVAIGDVAGHGISAALLMTTARAMLRTRIMQSGSLGEVVSDVNRLLCLDTDRTGDFMTLYVMMIDKTTWKLRWVRAGHAPAILYDWQNDSFEELRGEGSALGVLDSSAYEEYHYNSWNGSKLLFLGTDGIWETENPQGEMYGMERLRTLLREHCQFSAQAIIDTVMSDLTCFRDSSPQEDDITMVVLKSEQSTGSSENRT